MKLEAILEVDEGFCVYLYKINEGWRAVGENHLFAISGFPDLESVIRYCKQRFNAKKFRLLDHQGNFFERITEE